MKRTDLEETLLAWNPHWRPETVRGWSGRQLYAVYARERQRRVEATHRLPAGCSPGYKQLVLFGKGK